MISCTHCRKLFIPLFEDVPGYTCSQAMGCSANIFEREGKKYLMGSYGSTVADGDLYKVLTSKYKSGIICDVCISNNIHDFILLNDGNYFGIDL
jgi:hypothetical protein